MKDYLNVFYSDDNGCYIADIPDLRFCSAFGSTPEEAMREVQKAKRAWLRVAKDRRKSIPNTFPRFIKRFASDFTSIRLAYPFARSPDRTVI